MFVFGIKAPPNVPPPPTVIFFAIPTPPLTTTLPVLVNVLSVVFVTENEPPIVKLPEVVILGGILEPVI